MRCLQGAGSFGRAHHAVGGRIQDCAHTNLVGRRLQQLDLMSQQSHASILASQAAHDSYARARKERVARHRVGEPIFRRRIRPTQQHLELCRIIEDVDKAQLTTVRCATAYESFDD